MHMSNHAITEMGEEATFCPSCGGSDYDDNCLSERLYAEAAEEAPLLRFAGRTDEAIEVLTALYAIRIVNFVLPKWRCNACGVTFDA